MTSMKPGLVNPEDFNSFGPTPAKKLDDWLRNEGLAADLDWWFGDGGSGAKVAAVSLSARHKQWNEKMVLKLCPPGERTGEEVANINRCWDEAPPGFRAHLTEPWRHFEVGDTGALFMECYSERRG